MKTNQIEEMIKKAYERLESAKTLLDIDNYEDSISRSYYAVLDAARTLLIRDKIYPKSHSGTITKFHQKYIKTGQFPKEFSRILARIEKSRAEADYDFAISFSQDEARERFKQAEKFVKLVEKALKK